MTNRCAACGLDVYDGGEFCPLCRTDAAPDSHPANGDLPVEYSTDEKRTKLQAAALAAINEHGGVTAAARALGCNHGIIALARDGHDFPKARRVLGLPPKTVEVPPCPDCGQVHEQLHTCPDELQQTRKTKQYTVSFRFENESHAVALRQLFDAHGDTRREVGRKLLSGELRLVEANHDNPS